MFVDTANRCHQSGLAASLLQGKFAPHLSDDYEFKKEIVLASGELSERKGQAEVSGLIRGIHAIAPSNARPPRWYVSKLPERFTDLSKIHDPGLLAASAFIDADFRRPVAAHSGL